MLKAFSRTRDLGKQLLGKMEEIQGQDESKTHPVTDSGFPVRNLELFPLAPEAGGTG